MGSGPMVGLAGGYLYVANFSLGRREFEVVLFPQELEKFLPVEHVNRGVSVEDKRRGRLLITSLMSLTNHPEAAMLHCGKTSQPKRHIGMQKTRGVSCPRSPLSDGTEKRGRRARALIFDRILACLHRRRGDGSWLGMLNCSASCR